MIDAAIFDMDGLLLDSERATFEEFVVYGKKNGFDMTEDFYCTLLGRSRVDDSIDLANKFGGVPTDWEDVFDRVHDLLEIRYETKGVPMKVGVFELLESLRANNIKCALASSSARLWVERLMELTGLRKYFDYLICGDEVKNAKPDPEIFITACKKLGARKENSVVFEDSPSGIDASFNAEIPVICIPDMLYPDAERQKKTHKIFKTLLDAENYFEENGYEL